MQALQDKGLILFLLAIISVGLILLITQDNPTNLARTIEGQIESISDRDIRITAAEDIVTISTTPGTIIRDEEGARITFEDLTVGLIIRAEVLSEESTNRAITIKVLGTEVITVTSPKPGSVATNPLIISGHTLPGIDTVYFRLKTNSGTVLAEDFVKPKESGLEHDTFSFSLDYTTPTSTTGVLEVFTMTGDQEENLITIPLGFAQVPAASVKAFFSNRIEDPNALNCDVVYPATRVVPQENTTAEGALRELLKGPTNAESTAGFFTNIPAGVTLLSLRIENGTAFADFSKELAISGGSCRVMAIRSQIESTLRQFPTIERVVISAEGDSENILQP